MLVHSWLCESIVNTYNEEILNKALQKSIKGILLNRFRLHNCAPLQT